MAALGRGAVSYERGAPVDAQMLTYGYHSTYAERARSEAAKGRGFGIPAQLLYRNVQRFQGGLEFKAHRFVYHSTLGLRVKKKRKQIPGADAHTKKPPLPGTTI